MAMNDPSVVLKEGWIVLDESAQLGKALPTGFIVETREIIQALSPEGLRRVLIPLNEGPGPEDLTSAGVKIRNVTIGQGGSPSDYLEVKCELPRLNDLFDDLCAEMILAVVDDQEQPASKCIEILDRWRALLRSVRGQRPSRNSVIGVLGEMLVLERILIHDPRRRIDIWIGREGQRHDFRRGNTAIEVKSTLATEGRSLIVHGVHQLEEPEGGSLHLAWFRFEHVPGGSLSISGMASKLSSMGVPSELIHTGLDEHGLAPGTWPEETFELRESLGYLVDESFPRIVSRPLDAEALKAISQVQYRVDLDQAPEPVAESYLEQLFREMAVSG